MCISTHCWICGAEQHAQQVEAEEGSADHSKYGQSCLQVEMDHLEVRTWWCCHVGNGSAEVYLQDAAQHRGNPGHPDTHASIEHTCKGKAF